MPDLSNFGPAGKRTSHLMTYLFIAAFTAINGLYFGLRNYNKRPKYEIFNGGKVVSFHEQDTSDSTWFFGFVKVGHANITIDAPDTSAPQCH